MERIEKVEPQSIYPKINSSMVNIPNQTQPVNFEPPRMHKAKSFNQNRLNEKVLYRKTVKDLDEELIIKYW